MHEDVDGHPADRAEGGQGPDGALRRESEDISALADDDDCLEGKKIQASILSALLEKIEIFSLAKKTIISHLKSN